MGKKETRIYLLTEEQRERWIIVVDIDDNPKWMVLSIRKAFCWLDNGKKRTGQMERERAV